MAIAFKEKVAIGLGSAMLATGLFSTLQPPSSSTQAQRDAQQQERQIDQLSSAQEAENARLRAAGVSQGQADYAQRLVPVEPRPVEPTVRVRLLPR